MAEKAVHANPSKHRTPRHRAREFALQGIYQWLLNHEAASGIDAHIREAHGFHKADEEYFRTILHGVIKQAGTLRTSFVSLIDRPLSELSPVEHAVLLMGAFELQHQIEIPYRVVINEAVELSKSFGGADGHKYVNGVLDKLALITRVEEMRHATSSEKN